MMSLGIVHFMAFPETMSGEGPVLETVARIAEDDFFGAIEIRRPADSSLIPPLRAVLAGSGLEVGVAAQPNLLLNKLDLNAAEEGERLRAVAEVKGCIEFAYQVGARLCAVLSGPDPGPEQRAAAKERLRQSLVELCNYAKQKATDYEVTISLETFDRDVDKKCLLGPSAEAAEFAARVKESVDNFGLLLDLSHLPLLREDLAEALAVTAEHLIHAHAGNCVMQDKSNPLYGDLHPPFGIEGGENGVAELRTFLQALVYTGYFAKRTPSRKPILSFEVKPTPGLSSAAALANVKRTFWQAWAQA